MVKPFLASATISLVLLIVLLTVFRRDASGSKVLGTTSQLILIHAELEELVIKNRTTTNINKLTELLEAKKGSDFLKSSFFPHPLFIINTNIDTWRNYTNHLSDIAVASSTKLWDKTNKQNFYLAIDFNGKIKRTSFPLEQPISVK